MDFSNSDKISPGNDTQELLDNKYFQNKAPRPNGFIVLVSGVLFGFFSFMGLAEMIVAFIRNTHILGFIVGFFLFICSITMIAFLVMYFMKRGLPKKLWIVFYILFAITSVLFLLNMMFLSVKMMSYSQEPSRQTDFKSYQIFSEECHNTVKSCSEISVQSRVEGAKSLTEQGALLYVQTSHTEWFLGLITDGLYFVQLGPCPEDEVNKLEGPQGSFCVYADCNKRIANSPTSCGKLWKDFGSCMTKNDNENFLKCAPTI